MKDLLDMQRLVKVNLMKLTVANIVPQYCDILEDDFETLAKSNTLDASIIRESDMKKAESEGMDDFTFFIAVSDEQFDRLCLPIFNRILDRNSDVGADIEYLSVTREVSQGVKDEYENLNTSW